ncbi:hypothetical protein BT69DRAFT_1294191 [Atractiella rhizophila]|nr:hypothetical protein BT69DRAFT_1294191 [Atractiella rhizophila]
MVLLKIYLNFGARPLSFWVTQTHDCGLRVRSHPESHIRSVPFDGLQLIFKWSTSRRQRRTVFNPIKRGLTLQTNPSKRNPESLFEKEMMMQRQEVAASRKRKKIKPALSLLLVARPSPVGQLREMKTELRDLKKKLTELERENSNLKGESLDLLEVPEKVVTSGKSLEEDNGCDDGDGPSGCSFDVNQSIHSFSMGDHSQSRLCRHPTANLNGCGFHIEHEEQDNPVNTVARPLPVVTEADSHCETGCIEEVFPMQCGAPAPLSTAAPNPSFDSLTLNLRRFIAPVSDATDSSLATVPPALSATMGLDSNIFSHPTTGCVEKPAHIQPRHPSLPPTVHSNMSFDSTAAPDLQRLVAQVVASFVSPDTVMKEKMKELEKETLSLKRENADLLEVMKEVLLSARGGRKQNAGGGGSGSRGATSIPLAFIHSQKIIDMLAFISDSAGVNPNSFDCNISSLDSCTQSGSAASLSMEADVSTWPFQLTSEQPFHLHPAPSSLSDTSLQMTQLWPFEFPSQQTLHLRPTQSSISDTSPQAGESWPWPFQLGCQTTETDCPRPGQPNPLALLGRFI